MVIAFVPSIRWAPLIIDLVCAVRDQRQVVFLTKQDDASDLAERLNQKRLKDSSNQPWFTIEVVGAATPVADVLKRCRAHRAELLVTSVFSFDHLGSRPQTSRSLIHAAPCRTVTAMCGNTIDRDLSDVLVLANGGPHDLAALQLGVKLSESVGLPVSLAILEPNSGANAELAGQKSMRSLLHDAALDATDFETTVVVGDDRSQGVRRCLDGHALVVSGTDSFDDLWQSGFNPDQTTLLVVKRTPPLRLNSLPQWIPRINPQDHAELLHDLRQGSRWRTDFVAMLGLAAAIASLGMMQNSPAVVIGSMLLAPLMTPMIGLGLALTQANAAMARTCWESILRGFLLTLAVSLVLGTVTPDRETLSPEVLARGTPNLLDLLIAVFAAIAATTAMARPNISGAIAGVAIATALVPPICAVGLSLSRGMLANSLGALVLFTTNLVAIIVASSFTFSILGVSASAAATQFARRAKLYRWSLVALLTILAGPLSLALLSQLEKGRPQAAVYPVTRAVSRAIHDYVDQHDGVDVVFMGRSSVTDGVIIHLAADQQIPDSHGDEIRTIVQAVMDDDGVPVYVACFDGQWLSRPKITE